MSAFLAPYPPSLNRYLRHGRNGTYRTEAANRYRTAVAWAARAAGVRLLEGPVQVEATLHHRQTKKGAESKVRIDLDNALKVALDALNQVAYLDDRQVRRLVAEVGYPLPEGGLSLKVRSL